MGNYHELKDLPIAMNANDLSKALGLSRAGAYNLMDDKGFPTLRVGKRKIVMRDSFLDWLERNISSGM